MKTESNVPEFNKMLQVKGCEWAHLQPIIIIIIIRNSKIIQSFQLLKFKFLKNVIHMFLIINQIRLGQLNKKNVTPKTHKQDES